MCTQERSKSMANILGKINKYRRHKSEMVFKYYYMVLYLLIDSNLILFDCEIKIIMN